MPEEELAEVVIGEPEPEMSSLRQGFLRFLKERLTKHVKDCCGKSTGCSAAGKQLMRIFEELRRC